MHVCLSVSSALSIAVAWPPVSRMRALRRSADREKKGGSGLPRRTLFVLLGLLIAASLLFARRWGGVERYFPADGLSEVLPLSTARTPCEAATRPPRLTRAAGGRRAAAGEPAHAGVGQAAEGGAAPPERKLPKCARVAERGGEGAAGRGRGAYHGGVARRCVPAARAGACGPKPGRAPEHRRPPLKAASHCPTATSAACPA